MITKELINYKDFGNAVKISDGITEVIITVDIGPRIIRYGFVGGENLLNDTYHKSEEMQGPQIHGMKAHSESCSNILRQDHSPERYMPVLQFHCFHD